MAAIQDQEKPALYLETTVVSYLAARPSSDVVTLTHQEMTRQWWEKRRKQYAIFVSEVVHIEANRGDAEAARRRIQIIKPFPVLRATRDARELAKHYMSMIPLPRCAEADALHLAIAVINRMDYLVTWNCRHLAAARVRRAAEHINRVRELAPCTICTPEELLYEDADMD